MKLVTVNFNSIPLGQPLPFSLRSGDGILLAGKGYVFTEREALETLAAHGSLFVDPEESKQYRRQMASQLNALVNDNDTTLAQIADTKLSPIELQYVNPAGVSDDATLDKDKPVDWLDMQSHVNSLLRDPSSLRFLHRLDRLHKDLSRMVSRSPDTTLFALIHLTASETRFYSATHAMLVNVMCSLAARDVLNWDSTMETTMGRASLTMNIAMTDLQDQLVHQQVPLSAEQRELVDSHAARSVDILKKRGVTDLTWLGAVQSHHKTESGPLAGRTEAQQIARLIQRADGFAARLSPRASRAPMAPSMAMQATYFDESRKVDEAGASLIKAVGIYPPGSFVKLASQEIATVVRRGVNTLTPKVAVLVNKQGMPTVEPAIRDTRLKEYRIVSSVSHRDIKVRADLVRLLALI